MRSGLSISDEPQFRQIEFDMSLLGALSFVRHSRHIWWCVHHHKLTVRSLGDYELKLRNRRHFGFISATTWPQDKEAAVWVAKFYLKYVSILFLMHQLCRTGFQTLQQLIFASPLPQRSMICRVDFGIEYL